MSYTLLCNSPDLPLIDRLLKVKNLTGRSDDFLRPSYNAYRQDSSLLHNIDIATTRIIQAIESVEKVMIFGDYDVDGICASYVMYTCLRKYLGFHHVTIRLPHRVHDGYGIKTKHIDMAHELGCTLIITVDNGITAVAEADYARSLGIDLVVTDHHHAPATLPDATALVNPQLSPDMPQPEICGASVALKVCEALAMKLGLTQDEIVAMRQMMIPFVAIATVADCMPLLHENRLIVREGLRLMNQQRSQVAYSLQVLLDQLGIKEVDTYHIGYVIGPRLNATGRIDDAMHGLKALLYTDYERLTSQIAHMDSLNLRRKEIQDQMLQTATDQLDYDQDIMIASSESFHEGIVGIVAGRITNDTNKPSVIFSINRTEGIATASLRAPEWFSVIQMLESMGDLLERYGGHEQAGGLTVSLSNLEKLQHAIQEFATKVSQSVDTTPRVRVDTILNDHEISLDTIQDLQIFAPYGMANQHPLFLMEGVQISDVSTMGRGTRTHLKLSGRYGTESVSCVWWGAGDRIDQYQYGMQVDVIGKLREDTYRGGVMVEVEEIV